jgi:SPP1 gp7 family putative phage head morphogenesis protein
VADISPWMVDPQADEETRDGQLAAATRRAELLIRNHGFQAYEAAKWDVMQRQKDVFEFWQYHSMEDEKVRPEHAKLDGLILPADSPFWADHYPPWDWGCRCLVTALLPEEVEAIQGGEEEGFTLGPAAEQKLEEQGILDRGDGHPINVSSPRNSGKENAFQWNPGDLRIPVEDLQRRYDPEVWQTFEKWAKSQGLDAAGTVWDWLMKGAA